MPRDNEQKLIEQATQGNLDAFNQLVLAYQDRIYSLTYRIMGSHPPAADATQETFITAYRKLASYRGGSFKSWLLRIATNICYDQLRYRKRRPATAFEDLHGAEHADGPPIPDHADTPEQAMQRTELQQAIADCIAALQPDQRVSLVMCDVEDYAYQEIAKATNTSLGTVKSRISRARRAVQDCLQGYKELLPTIYRQDSNDP